MAEQFVVEPLHDKIIVKQLKGEQEVDGLYLPDSAIQKPNVGIVVAVGPGKFYGTNFVATTIKESHKILFNKMAGFPQKIDGEEYLIISETDVIAIFN